MKNNNWSLFVDVDGTIFSKDPIEWEKNVFAFHKFCHEFDLNRFVATGRHPTHMATILSDVVLTKGALTTLNGGMVVCDGEIIGTTKYSDDVTRTVYNYLFKHDFSFFIFMEDRVRYTHVREHTQKYRNYVENYTGKDMSVAGKIENVEKILESGGAYKFLVIIDELDIDKDLRSMLNKLGLVHGFSYPKIYEINPPGVDKGKGVRTIIDHLDLDITKTMGIGDGENDLGLASQCTLSVAMEQSAPRLKENTTAVAPSKGFVSALSTMKDLLVKELKKEKK